MRPNIGVTGEDSRFPIAWWFIRWAVWRSGGRAQRMTPMRPSPPSPMHGVIISGGADIDPGLYLGLDDAAPAGDFPRDRFESAVIRNALDNSLPLLGICRGAQLINVIRGGSLYQDIRPLRRLTPNRRSPCPVKTVELDADSKIHDLMGRARVPINSLHQQAVDRLGSGLRIVGRDRDGFVQAIEAPDCDFLLGVQWHPEYLPHKPEQRALFRALVRASKA